MSKYLFILALIPSALAAVSNTLPWSICHDTNAFSIHNVEITYDRDTRLLWAYGEGTASAEVSTGKVKTNLEIFGFEYFEEKTDICVAVDCPLKPGKFVFNKNVTIPINFPLLDWAPKFEFETTDGQPLFCVSSHLSLAYPILNYVLIYASLFVAVSSGFTTLMTRYLRHGYNMTLYDMSSGWAPTARLLPSRIYPGFVDVAMFAQFVAFTGMFTMEYPHAYQDFTRYFVWAVGTWNTAFIASIAKTIRAGGWHFLEFKTRLAQGRSGLMTLHKRVVAPTAIVEEGAVNGFQRYASIIDLNERDVFLHTLIAFVICLILISVGCFGVAVVRSVRRARAPRPTIDDISVRSLHHQHHHIRHYYLGWVVRTLMLFYFGLTSTSLYQLTLSDEPPVVYALAGIVFSVLGLILPAAMTARLIGIARMNRTLTTSSISKTKWRT
ncbi:hypothetical protein BC832DRAFT_390674 [Gaertneriomyces semiglobifer]|nr:hypothetical protein BC832DRAFT_390674 [Gaertneriomyces semiglobifer]